MYQFDDYFPYETSVAEPCFKCEQDGQRYPESEMVFDVGGACHVHKENIDAYLLNFERDMDKWEFDALKQSLINQIK